MENFSDIIENKNHDLPACSAVPQPTVTPPAPVKLILCNNNNSNNNACYCYFNYSCANLLCLMKFRILCVREGFLHKCLQWIKNLTLSFGSSQPLCSLENPEILLGIMLVLTVATTHLPDANSHYWHLSRFFLIVY
jgi:hypothetical protein